MIPYEELVAALARWRARHGLPTGLGDYLGEPPRPAHGGPALRDHSRDEVVELGDEHLEGMIESHVAHGNGAGEHGDLGDHDLHDHGPDLVDFGAPGTEESTKPAGLAGLIDAGPPPDVEIDAAHEPDDHGPSAESRPAAKGRSRGGGRRRRK